MNFFHPARGVAHGIFAGVRRTVSIIALCLAIPRILLAACDGFPALEDIGQQLDEMNRKYPQLTRADDLGTSVEGRPIRSLEISGTFTTPGSVPEIRIIGGIHGNECQSVAEVLHIMNWLLEGYETDAELGRFIDEIEFLFIPLVNPDGYADTPPSRFNADYIDLNRNFGFGWSEATPGEPFSEPESRAVRNISQQHAFALGLSYHTEAGYVNGPWNYTPFYPRDDALIDAIGRDYAGESDYDVVFGWDWYQISGDVNDWSLGTQGTFDWTIELTESDDLVWDVHEPALRSFFSWAFRGVRGKVVDAVTGLPLHGMITVEPEGEPVFTHPTTGVFHRILLDGTYEVTAWAPGYHPRTIEPVVVRGDQPVIEFQLTPDAAFTGGFQINEMTLPRDISNQYVATNGYDNDTIVSDALGMPDGYAYSLGAGGTVTIDMGAAWPVTDQPGDDLRIVSATGSDEMARIYAATDQDGPFAEIGAGAGDIALDLARTSFDSIRYIRVVDENNVVPFNAAGSGYDLDAVVNLSVRSPSDTSSTDTDKSDEDTDSATGPENTNDSDPGQSSDSGREPGGATARSGASDFPGCHTAPRRPSSSLLSLILD